MVQSSFSRQMKEILLDHRKSLANLKMEYKSVTEYIKKGDVELEAGVIRQVKVYVATKRKLHLGAPASRRRARPSRREEASPRAGTE